MNNRRIYIFTSEFPYGNQETFLETEIEILSNFFNITLLPLKIISQNKRKIPSSVIVDQQLSDLFEKKRFHKRFSFLNIFFWRTLFKYFKYINKIQSIKRIASFTAEYCQVITFIKSTKFNRNDILYSYWFNGVAYAISQSVNTINVTRAHRYDVYEDLYKPVFMLYRQNTIDNLNKIYFISKSGLNHVEKRYQSNGKFLLSRLGTSFKSEKKFDSEDFSDRNILNVVTISNLHPVKRVDLIAQRLIDFSIHFNNYLIQWDHFGDGPELEKVKTVLDGSNTNLKFNFYSRVSNNTIHKFLADNNYDVLINLSSSEGLPVSMMEAISYGIPILATDVGGVNEIVNDITGLLISERATSEEFIESLSSLKEKINKGEYKRSSIHEFWVTNFNAQRNYVEFSHSLFNLLNNE